METIFANLAIMLIIILAGLMLTVIGLKFFDNSEMRKRIDAFIIEPRASSLPSNLSELQNQEFTENLLQRTLFVWINQVVIFLGRFTPGQSVQQTNQQLAIAGNPNGMRAQQFYGIRFLFFVMGLGLAFLIFQNRLLQDLSWLFAVLVLVVFSIMPDTWLKMLMRQRQDAIRRSLPDALDMLSVCTAAGLSFDQSMLRVGQMFKTAIGYEFARVISEIEVGITRQQALRNLQARTDISELSSFVAVILQSEVLGMSISDVLRAQAEQMRVYRQYRAKEEAQKLPAKMMVPLVFFIFPALLAVLLGPTIPSIMDALR
jgi:tight adherence protein C